MSFHRIKPILFNTEMVRAILEGRKTVTRRLPGKRIEDKWYEYDEYVSAVMPHDIPCVRCNEKEFYEQYPPYQTGDILYVRETWGFDNHNWLYKADFSDEDLIKLKRLLIWHPSIHMPKKAARIWLKVTDVRFERLQDIDGRGAEKEGMDSDMPITNFIQVWNSTIKKQDLEQYGWDANPWVWVIEFERIER